MAGGVKGRGYDGSARRARSDATRRRILDVARAHLVERGYRATTIAGVAAGAGVHVDTVYALAGRKPVLLRLLVEQALSGTDHEVPAHDRPYVAAIRAEPDPARKLAIYAAATADMLGRAAPLLLALRDAAATDAAADRLRREFGDRRAANMRLFVQDVADAGGLRPGLAVDDAAETVWATNSPELYALLTTDRGWAPARYAAWLADTWRRLLLPPA